MAKMANNAIVSNLFIVFPCFVSSAADNAVSPYAGKYRALFRGSLSCEFTIFISYFCAFLPESCREGAAALCRSR